MTYKSVYECDVCGKQELAAYLGSTSGNPRPSLPKGWTEISVLEGWKPIHVCSSECGARYFERRQRVGTDE